ncbi:hypothetical protein CO008_01795 [Candidatus Roizmanbacteria bacterium CG_4_8_14_3_um_filter_36_12]|uniref:DUF4012 domain-containing protein n=1 Tax=Candidatus Roizmanbacteria bacterium CG_4_9_14_0_2_um_filter_36_12 TaxID=1974837 RepID=A0A2M8F128_9BACT|nr:MAG: hypothetical protein CO049_01460 [Candidatus Roizmanbacteria bacterium CG_4_9_14_0_2_um_filter_36_12]PJC80447.1 MAG: hypothetical protein CO008_01795 [Candidatus Roizmanbacteria bacterium CG_4_8_14_3_um_filter_36_12]
MKKQKKLFLPLLIVLILGYFFIVGPILRITVKAKALVSSAKELKSVFAKNDIALLKTKMADFSNQYQNFEKTAKSAYWASFIPYVSDFKNGVEAGSYMVKAGVETVVAIEPYADLIGFKKGGVSFIEKSAEDRLQTAVLTLDKLVQKIDPIAADIEMANSKIAKINSNRYPKKLGKTVVRENVANIKDQFEGTASLFVNAKPLIKKLPEILGSTEEKTYLILYQNDKERRATGGFLTFYAVFKIKKGKMKIDRSNDIYSLDETIADHPKAPREILTYHKDVSVFNIRDSNLSPDFVESIKLFESLYQRSGDRVKYDGIIAMDSEILVDMLTIFGDTKVDGVNFSAKEDKRCDCPQAIYTLFDVVDRPVNYFKENRKGILGNLMYVLFYKAIGYSPSKYWGTLMQTMYKNMEEKHILLYFVNSELQKSVEQINFAGRINDYKGDYLHINSVNFAGAKANLFVSEEIESVTKGKNREVTVNFRNPYPHSDCNLERGGLCLNATLRNWIRIYVPKGSTLDSFQGSQKKVQTYDDLGKTVFEGYLEVPTQGKATVIIKYSLPSGVSQDSLLIQKQPGVTGQKWTVKIDNKKVFEGILEKDKEIKVK